MSNIKKIVMTSLFAAMVCVTTLVVQIPSPTGGYINAGDCFVLLSVYLGGPVCGGIAAGIGSMLADLIMGYVSYAPATLVIKALVAVVGYFVWKKLLGVSQKQILSMAVAGIAGEIVMIAGYFGYESILLGSALAAVSGIPGNLGQAAFAVIASTLIYKLLQKANVLKLLEK